MKKWNLSCWSLWILLALWLYSWTAWAQISPVVLTGQPVPGTDNEVFSSLGPVDINGEEEIVFLAGTSGKEDGKAICHEYQGAISLVARTGHRVSDMPSQIFSDFAQPRINDSGEIVFIAGLLVEPGPQREEAIFIRSSSTLRRLANTGMEIPGVPGYTYSLFRHVQVNNRGEVAFVGDIHNGDSTRTGIFLAVGGTIKTVFLHEKTVDGLGYNSPSEISFNHAGHILFVAAHTESFDGLYLYNGSSITTIAVPGQSMSGSNLILESTIRAPRMNDRQEITFINGHKEGNDYFYQKALVRWREGTLDTLAVTGESIPGYRNILWGYFFNYGINNHGTAVFLRGGCILGSRSMMVRSILIGGDKNPGVRINSGVGVSPRDFVQKIGGLHDINDADINDRGTLVFMSNIVGAGEKSGIFRADAVASRQYFPQVAAGISQDTAWQTTFRLKNRNTEPAFSTLSFWNQDGTAMAVEMEDSAASGFSFTIPPGGTITLSTTAQSGLRSGWAQLTSDKSVTGTAMFSMMDGTGKLLSNVAVPGSLELSSFAMLAEVRPGVNTAVALANPSETDAIVRLAVKNANGISLAGKILTLTPKTQLSRFLTELFDAAILPAPLEGSIDVTADRPILALTLRQQDQVFTSMPILP